MANESPFDEFDFEAVESNTLQFIKAEKEVEEISDKKEDDKVEADCVENIPVGGNESADVNKNINRNDKLTSVNHEELNLLEPKIELDIEDTESGWKPYVKPEFDSAKGGYVCEICFKCLKSSRVLKIHKKNMHSNRERVQCQHCDKTFSSTSCLKRHLQTHNESGKTHYCDMCDRSFYRASDVRSHIVSVHSERIKCTHCEKTFHNAKHLIAHQVINHGAEKPEGVIIHECNQCDKAFIKMNELTRHKVTHTREKNFICPTCGKGFPYSWNLAGHMLVHSEEKSFKCEICPKTFKTRSTLNRHNMLNRHKFGTRYKEKQLQI